MHRLNLTIDEPLYEQARLHSFITKKSISHIVRESLRNYMSEQKDKNKLALSAQGEEEILRIIQQDDFITEEEFIKQFNL